MGAYYNEFDPKAAAWLRQLIKNGDIAPGEVDERSIIDVSADDLAGFAQHHFFAGIGVWSYALRNAGWSDDRPVCTASLPCQPFSGIGKKKGYDDDRHLWPVFFRLAKEYGFATIIGEQVASKDGLAWLDGVQTDMESEGYSFASADLCAAGVGSPHIRQRLYWVGDADFEGLAGHNRHEPGCGEEKAIRPDTEASGSGIEASSMDAVSVLRRDDMHDSRHARERLRLPGDRRMGSNALRAWDRFESLPCSDGWRRVQPGTFPLVDGSAEGMGYSGDPSQPINADYSAEARVMRLKGYGNAIHAGTAQMFIESFMDSVTDI